MRAEASQELQRIADFLRRVDGLVGNRRAASAVGSAVIMDDLPLVWRRVNVLRVEPGAAGDADLVIEEAERLLGEAGCRHRAAVLRFPALAPLARRIGDAGWTIDRELVLLHRHQRRPPAEGAEEVELEELEPMLSEFRRKRPYGSDEELLAQLAQVDRRYAERARARFFGAKVDGRWASGCQLFTHGGIAEIHAVGTSETHRGRGLAKAVVASALEASARSGNEFTFIQAVEADWPQRFYRRLGFEEAGLFYELYRFDEGHPARPLYERQ